MASFLQKIRSLISQSGITKLILAHKIASGIVGLVVVIGGYYVYSTFTNTGTRTHYILGSATTGTIVSSVSGSGQVSASNEIDIKPTVSAEVMWVGVKPGDSVYAGQALMSLDATTIKQSIASAEADLKTAELQYQKDQAQAPIDYQSAVDSLNTATEALASAYTDAYNTLSTTYLDLPNVTTAMNDVLFGYDLSSNNAEWNVDVLTNMFTGDDRDALTPFVNTAKTDYTTAENAYKNGLADYQTLTRSSPTTQISSLLDESVTTTSAVAEALQSELNFLSTVNDLATKENRKLPVAVTTLLNTTRSNLTTANTDLDALLSEKKTLDADTEAIKTDQNNITLMQVGNTNGTNPITLQISAANLEKQKQDLQNLQDQLANYTVVAPFSGTISAVDVQRGETPSGTVASLIAHEDIAALSLNEVDVAKIQLGDKTTLTFDAIDGLTLTGAVAGIDAVGTVSQGVVSYTVKIIFTSQDTRIKPGMTANAQIQTTVKQNVIMVPASAVKTQGGQSYVLVFTPPLSQTANTSTVVSQGITTSAQPTQVPVTTGISDDTNVEITSGVTDGEQIVVRTTSGSTASAASTATSRTSTTNRGGGLGGGGGAVLRGL